MYLNEIFRKISRFENQDYRIETTFMHYLHHQRRRRVRTEAAIAVMEQSMQEDPERVHPLSSGTIRVVPKHFMVDFEGGAWFAGLQNTTHAIIETERPTSASNVKWMGPKRDDHRSRFSQKILFSAKAHLRTTLGSNHIVLQIIHSQLNNQFIKGNSGWGTLLGCRPVAWPPRPCDLTSLDYFYGVIRNRLFRRLGRNE